MPLSQEKAMNASMEAAVAAEFGDLGDGSADEGELLALMVHN